ncbi:hypothetical protein [Acinetobacter venetianus]|uniref:hypothetical protein n=1 Tax=Acinetobacter venetianus TaxID=52133 RepID=UPI003A8D12B2
MKQPTYEQFLKDVNNHVLTVNLDQECYRDLTIRKPDSIDMHYHITTRPGYLFFSGDMGSFVFERNTDMFAFFRGEGIKPHYWAEKVEAGKYKQFSPEAAREALDKAFEYWKEDTEKDEEFIAEEKQQLDCINTDDEFEFHREIYDFSPNKGGVELNDFYESNLTELTYHYLWCCYAIVHAIKLYDQQKEVIAHG